MLILGLGAFACEQPAFGARELPMPKEDLPLAEQSEQRTAVLAAGCFWCVEAVFERLDGVIDVVSGYAGDSAETAQYKIVSSGRTNHAEVVQVTYDASKITYGQLLRVFFGTHNPTTLNRQGPDVGRQYRSAIFYQNEDEKRVAEAYIRQLNEEGPFTSKKVVTTVEPLEQFYPAEEVHQDFVRINPTHPYVRQWVPEKLEKLEKLLADQPKAPATQPGEK